MIRSTRMLWGMLLVAPLLGGCGDSLAPLPGSEVGVRDLEFVLPSFKELRVRSVGTDSTHERTAMPAELAALRSGGGGSEAYIHSTHLTSGFSGTDLWYEYGMTGYGTGWSMSPNYNINAPGTGISIEKAGSGMSANYFVPMSFEASNREGFRTSTTCGLTANVSVHFKAWFGLKLEPLDVALNTTKSAYSSTSQPGCPPVNGGGGGGTDPGTSTGVKICYWEVWVDMDGYIVDIVFRGCYSAGGYQT